MLTADQAKRLAELYAIFDSDRLTDWEAEFVTSLEEQVTGDPTYSLSEKQEAVLDRIWRKAIGGERPDPHHRDAPKKSIKALASHASMPMIVVYKNPSDFPGKYVARRLELKPNGTAQFYTSPVAVRDTYEQVRVAVLANLPGATRIDRDPMDDPVIVEIWL